MKRASRVRRWGLGVCGFLALLLVAMIVLNEWMLWKTRPFIQSPSRCTPTPVAIVFGTSRYLRNGRDNPHYHGRLNLAAQLYREGRIQHLILSGDNRSRYYNEPVNMQKDLMALGVPPEAMTLDYAGLSTFDTLVRAREVFGVQHALLVSQSWHLPRALFIARALGLNVEGCSAYGPTLHWSHFQWWREVLARLATLGDLFIWQRSPRFLGPHVDLPDEVMSPGD